MRVPRSETFLICYYASICIAIVTYEPETRQGLRVLWVLTALSRYHLVLTYPSEKCIAVSLLYKAPLSDLRVRVLDMICSPLIDVYLKPADRTLDYSTTLTVKHNLRTGVSA